ncbi:hypothetical protein ACEPAF_5198 [Sanghuangporus sanghuang]
MHITPRSFLSSATNSSAKSRSYQQDFALVTRLLCYTDSVYGKDRPFSFHFSSLLRPSFSQFLLGMSRPAHHANATKTLFQNPWKTPDEPDDNVLTSSVALPQVSSLNQAQENSWFNTLTGALPTLSSLLASIPLERAQDLSSYGISPTKVIRPDFDKFEKNKQSVKATWLGHASFLVELPQHEYFEKPIRLLFDPMFSDRAGPSAWTGIRRRLPPPCTIADIPEFQFVLVSHNHYDHLDLPSIQEIFSSRGEDVTFLVPLGIKKCLISVGIPKSQIYELDWWDEIVLPPSYPEANSDSESGPSSTPSSVTLACVPAQHASGRSVLDRCETLWCGWVVKQKSDHLNCRIYHAGDTGYLGTRGACPAFKEIGERYGPIDLAMIPIWRGGTLSFVSQLGLRLTHHPFLSAMHASPADAVAIHQDVQSCHTIAMHFATFSGTENEALEPLVELTQAREEANLANWWEEGGVGAIDIGETVEIPVLANRLSTQKRSWDGTSITRSNGNPAKRSREDNPRDWKDVYLNGIGEKETGREIKTFIGQIHGEKLKDIARKNGIEIIVTGSVAMYQGVVVMMMRVTRNVRNGKDDHESEREEGEISPAASHSPTPVPPQLSTTISTRNSTSSPIQLTQSATPLTTINNIESQMELDLETETTSKPVEETIAERRARRQAIRAKYAGITSAAMSTDERASQSPGPSSAVSQPPPSASEANLTSKVHSSVAAIPHLTDEKTIKIVDAGTYPLSLVYS